jgi:hypothetical protein
MIDYLMARWFGICVLYLFVYGVAATLVIVGLRAMCEDRVHLTKRMFGLGCIVSGVAFAYLAPLAFPKGHQGSVTKQPEIKRNT